MPTFTSNFNFNKPLVNDPIDEDLWGGFLNANWDSVDTILDALTPIGTRAGYVGATSPNSRWLLAYGQEISRATYSVFFALIGTSYGVGDGATTFNMPDYRGRVGAGLDNLGGVAANRLTNSNADSLNNAGLGSETGQGINSDTGSHALTISEIPSHDHDFQFTNLGFDGDFGDAIDQAAPTSTVSQVFTTNTTGGGLGHAHTGSVWTGVTGANAQPTIAEGVIIRVL